MAPLLFQVPGAEAATASLTATLIAARLQGEAGGGLVKVTCDGRCRLVSVRVDPSLVQAGKAHVIEDLVVSTIVPSTRYRIATCRHTHTHTRTHTVQNRTATVERPATTMVGCWHTLTDPVVVCAFSFSSLHLLPLSIFFSFSSSNSSFSVSISFVRLPLPAVRYERCTGKIKRTTVR